MPIHMTCPACGAAYTLGDDLAGKKGRCKKCGETFRVRIPEGGQAPGPGGAVANSAAPPESPGVGPEEPRRRKKKRRVAEGGSNRLVVGLVLGSCALAFVIIGVAVTLILLLRGGSDPKSTLVGKWKGAVQVQEAVEGATKGSNLPPIASGILGALAQKATDAIAAVEVDFKKSGNAFFTGNTACLGFESAADGPWEVVRRDEDIVIVRMGPADQTFEARLAFKDRDTFILTRPDKKEMPPVVFVRFD
jgi:predicted Zn finger-like uncharacterized protein